MARTETAFLRPISQNLPGNVSSAGLPLQPDPLVHLLAYFVFPIVFSIAFPSLSREFPLNFLIATYNSVALGRLNCVQVRHRVRSYCASDQQCLCFPTNNRSVSLLSVLISSPLSMPNLQRKLFTLFPSSETFLLLLRAAFLAIKNFSSVHLLILRQ